VRALIAVSSEFKIPMGIEWISQEPSKPIKLRRKRTTVRAIIESVARTQTGYQLEVGDAMLHVFYNGAKADPSNFLNIKIPEFNLQNMYVAEARRTLERIVSAKVAPPPPGKPVSVGGETILDPRDKRQDFHWENANVREILDGLTLAGDYKIWVVTFPESSALTPTGFRPTLSLWVTNARPNHLPSWDRFDWTHGPPPPPSPPRSRGCDFDGPSPGASILAYRNPEERSSRWFRGEVAPLPSRYT
jgi:hypothetical protein